MNLMRSVLLAASALTPGAVMAQSAAPDDASATRAADNAAISPTEIVVTARKTEERLQDAPLAVAVVTAAAIDRLGFNSVTDLTRATAGLVFDDSFGRDANRPVIRGQANILGDSGVAFFIDGIYFNGSIADYDIDIIDRIEVVKGPQSALYGRNTYSGAINIISKAPTDRWRGRVQADVSEGAAYDITGNTELAVALGRAEAAWKRAADLKPVFVSNQAGSGAILPNHLSSMAFYLYEAEKASSELAALLAPAPAVAAPAEVAQAAEELDDEPVD